MIVISNPVPIKDEIKIIQALFESGLELLHIRKPNFSEDDMKAFLSKIKPEFRNKLVLHQHHNLAEKFEIKRLHFTEKDRINPDKKPSKTITFLSTSVHTMEDFNNLPNIYQYAFLSPVYPSISKTNYVPLHNPFEEIKKRTNATTQLIALGGIASENISKTLENGFDDIALLGTIWNSENPIKEFKKCQQIAQL